MEGNELLFFVSVDENAYRAMITFVYALTAKLPTKFSFIYSHHFNTPSEGP